MPLFIDNECNDTNYLCSGALGMPVQSESEVVTIDATAGGNVNATALTIGRVYSFRASVSCFIACGADDVEVAINEDYYLPAGQEVVWVATQEYIAVIRESVSGKLFINLLDGNGEGAPA